MVSRHGVASGHETTRGQAAATERLSRALLPALVLTGMVTIAAALTWSARHPLGTSWDEFHYLNVVTQDAREVREYGLVGALRRIRWTDRERPPAYRVLLLPLSLFIDPDLKWLRVLSLGALVLTVALMFWAARQVAGRSVAVIVAAAFGLSFAPLWAILHFGTEYVLYPATAGLFACLFYASLRKLRTIATVTLWAGLAASVALGALSKTSFLVIAAPALTASIAVGWWKRLGARNLWVVTTATIAGLLGAAPWWIVNYPAAAGYARFASGFSRHQQGWMSEAFWRLLGPPLTALGVAFVIVLVLRRARLREALAPERGATGLWVTLAACAAGAVSLLVVHLAGVNPLARLLSPALVPALLGAGVLARAAGNEVRRTAVVFVLGVFVAQGAYITHRFFTSHIDQWDWERLLVLSDQRGIDEPVIAHLGNGVTFNQPAISYPWVRRGRSISERWLWRLEDGPIDWSQVTRTLQEADVVVTAPGYRGNPLDSQPEDNRHNVELAARLGRSPLFDAPVELRMGSSRTRVLVFFRHRATAAGEGSD